MAATSDHDPTIDDLSRELYWAQERVSRARMDTPEVRDRLLDLSMQLRADEKVIIPQGEGNLASTSRWRRQAEVRACSGWRGRSPGATTACWPTTPS